MESIILEIRPRIQVCSVYILMKNNYDVNLIKIRVKSSEIILSCTRNSKEIIHKIKILDCYKLMPNSVSSLSILKKSIYFRVLTEPRNSIMGSFASEILPFEQKEVKMNLNMNIPKIEAGLPTIIKCNCCGFLVKANINFNRVLPLPTNILDMSEWFCHKHNHCESSELMSVRKGDCLYGQFFVLINDEKLSSKGKVLTCLRCLSWLGTCDTNFCKLWNCSVTFGSEIYTSSPLKDFSSVIVHSMDKTIGIMNKLIIETVVSEGKTHYLLIWVLDKDLNVFFKHFTCDADSSFKDTETQVNLKSVLKVVYLFQEHCSELVKEWQADMYVQSIDVAKQMFAEGLNHLISLTECIPNPHKIWNNFFVSYIIRN